MSILPVLTARAVMQKLARGGFRFIYAKGSHYYFQHPLTRRITSVSMHSGKSIGRGFRGAGLELASLERSQF